jgi:hypothetical protein
MLHDGGRRRNPFVRPGEVTGRQGGCYTCGASPMRARRTHILMLAVATAAFPVVLVLPGMETGVLFLSPAIVLLASLLTGRYVGEDRLARLAAARRPSRPRRPRAARLVLPRRREGLMPRGGRLVATSLAVRPPPAVPAVR